MAKWLIVLCLLQITLANQVEVVTSKQPIVRYENNKMKIRIPILIQRRLEPKKENQMTYNVSYNESLMKANNVKDMCVSSLKNNDKFISDNNTVGEGNNDIHSRKRDLSDDNNNESLNVVSGIALNNDICNTRRWLNLNPRKVKKQPKQARELARVKQRGNTENRRQSDYMTSINDAALMKHLKKIRKKKSRRDDREEDLQYDLDDEELYLE